MSLTTGTTMLAVQRAVYGLLGADAALMRLVSGVFDEVPDGQAYPYLTVGEATEAADNTLDRLGRDLTVTLHIWSRGKGFAEALTILDEVVRVLDGAELVLDEGVAWRCQYEVAHTLRDPDGITRHVPVTFRVGTQL